MNNIFWLFDRFNIRVKHCYKFQTVLKSKKVAKVAKSEQYIFFLFDNLEVRNMLQVMQLIRSQKMKNIAKYGHNCKHRKRITITFQVVNFYWLIILIILVSSPHAHFKETYSLRGNSGILEFHSNFVCRHRAFEM